MTPAGWAIMIGSVGAICVLTVYCLYRVLTLPPMEAEEHIKSPLNTDTRDTQDPY